MIKMVTALAARRSYGSLSATDEDGPLGGGESPDSGGLSAGGGMVRQPSHSSVVSTAASSVMLLELPPVDQRRPGPNLQVPAVTLEGAQVQVFTDLNAEARAHAAQEAKDATHNLGSMMGTKSLASLAPSVNPSGEFSARFGGEAAEATWAHIWKSLQLEDIEKLRMAFEDGGQSGPGELNLYEFINAVRHIVNAIRSSAERLHTIVSELKELFVRIDVNGDGLMTWEEFSAFIVDNADAVLDEGSVYRKIQPPPLQIKNAPSDYTEQIFIFPGIRKLGAAQSNGAIAICDIHDGSVVKRLVGHEGSILATLHVPQRKCVVTSSIDRSIILWNDTSFNREQLNPTQAWHLCFAYSVVTSTLLSGSTDGYVYRWSLEPPHLTMLSRMHMHGDWVTTLLELPELGVMLSASLDKKIKVWEVSSGSVRHELVGHQKGILNLAYSPKFRLVFSSGFDRDICVWSPVLPGVLHRLKGHDKSILSIYVGEESNELISVDVGGKIKLWDVRTYQSLQSLEYGNYQWTGAVFDPYLEQLITFDYDWYRWKFDDATEETSSWPIVACRYNKTFSCFVIAAANSVTVWSAHSGDLVSTFEQAANAEITAMELHPLERQIALGFQDGSVKMISHTTGGIVKKFRALHSEIMHMFYINDREVAVCSSVSTKVKVFHVESIPDHPRSQLADHVRHWKCNMSEITCGVYNSRYQQLVLCGPEAFEVWRSTGLMTVHRRQPNDQGISACTLAGDLNMLVTANVAGIITLWTLPRYQMRMVFDTSKHPLIQSMTYISGTSQLITNGMVDRGITVWELGNILRQHHYLQAQSGRDPSSLFITAVPETDEIAESTGWVVRDYAESYAVCDDSLTCVCSTENPPSVVCGSFDGKVRLVNPEGDLLGLLNRQKAGWNFPMDMDAHRSEVVRDTAAVIDECNRLAADKGVIYPPARPASSMSAEPTIAQKLETISPFFHDSRATDTGYVVQPFFMPKQRPTAKRVIMEQAYKVLEDRSARGDRRPSELFSGLESITRPQVFRQIHRLELPRLADGEDFSSARYHHHSPHYRSPSSTGRKKASHLPPIDISSSSPTARRSSVRNSPLSARADSSPTAMYKFRLAKQGSLKMTI